MEVRTTPSRPVPGFGASDPEGAMAGTSYPGVMTTANDGERAKMSDSDQSPTDPGAAPDPVATPDPGGDGEPVHPQVVDPAEPTEASESEVHEPSKLIRIASMTRAMLEEVREAPLDDAGKELLREVYARSLDQLQGAVSADLAEELSGIFVPLDQDEVSESEVRLVQAQLVGWLEGLFHGIQASLFTQQMAATAQLEEVRRRRALEAGSPGGNYL